MLPSFLRRLASSRTSPPSRPTLSAARQSRLSLENLEGRVVPSASALQALVPAAPVMVQTQAVLQQARPDSLAINHPILPPVFFHHVPNLAGLDFHLISTNGAPAHDLVIKTEVQHFFTSSASFTGTWSGANGGVNQITDGSLHFINPTTTSMQFSFANGTHSFRGTVTWVPNVFNGHIILPFGHYHLDGVVTVAGNPNGGPGHVEGNAFIGPIVLHA
jgi:hypothetical protein